MAAGGRHVLSAIDACGASHGERPDRRLWMEMDLEAEGFATAGPFVSDSSTLAWLGTETPDSAILDPQHKDGTSLEIAALLIQRNVPFVIFSASCKHENTSPEFAHAQWIEKPRPGQEVVQLLVGQQRQMRVQAAAHSHSQLRLTNPPPLSSVSSQPISQRPLHGPADRG